MVGGGSEVERHVSSSISNGGPRWRGAVESRRRTCVEVRAQVEAPSSAMVALMVVPLRAFRFGISLWRWAGGIVVEETSEERAQGVFSRMC
jgi:hypothetical protein